MKDLDINNFDMDTVTNLGGGRRKSFGNLNAEDLRKLGAHSTVIAIIEEHGTVGNAVRAGAFTKGMAA